jgi:GNAT superfamily N-acetyltransferase
VTWTLDTGEHAGREDALTERLVGHNLAASPIVRKRFEAEHLRSRPVAAYALEGGRLVGGCVGRTEDLWRWLTVDTMWVDPVRRGAGIGRALLASVEEQARGRGCSWSKLNTFDFQAPGFYAECGYVEYGREEDYPPGHVNHLMRRDL